jgi:hypothetical protein
MEGQVEVEKLNHTTHYEAIDGHGPILWKVNFANFATKLLIMNVVKHMDHICIWNELLGLLKQSLLP